MRGLEVVAVVIIAFFVIGIGVGVLFVTALPAFRRRRGVGWDGEYRRRPDLPPPGHGHYGGYGDYGPGWQEPPDPDDDDTAPRWPGGTSA